jgi:PilZ domain
MIETPPREERRKHPRTLVSLPLHIQVDENEAIYPGLTLDASESGLLIQTPKEMPVGIRIDIEVFFPRKFKLSNFKAEAEIIWKDFCYWDDWEEYQYGLKFIQISKEDYLKLKQILSDPTRLKETDLIERRDHNPKLIVRTE